MLLLMFSVWIDGRFVFLVQSFSAPKTNWSSFGIWRCNTVLKLWRDTGQRYVVKFAKKHSIIITIISSMCLLICKYRSQNYEMEEVKTEPLAKFPPLFHRLYQGQSFHLRFITCIKQLSAVPFSTSCVMYGCSTCTACASDSQSFYVFVSHNWGKKITQVGFGDGK